MSQKRHSSKTDFKLKSSKNSFAHNSFPSCPFLLKFDTRTKIWHRAGPMCCRALCRITKRLQTEMDVIDQRDLRDLSYNIHPTRYKGCNYLSMLGVKLNYVSKRSSHLVVALGTHRARSVNRPGQRRHAQLYGSRHPLPSARTCSREPH